VGKSQRGGEDQGVKEELEMSSCQTGGMEGQGGIPG
jgi:hypothetical protein